MEKTVTKETKENANNHLFYLKHLSLEWLIHPPEKFGGASAFKHLSVVRRNPRDFDYVAFLQPPYRLDELALLFSAQLEILHHLLHRSLSRPASLKPTLQVVYDAPLDLSALPSGVSEESGNGHKHLLGF
jgi:hypothetical protein